MADKRLPHLSPFRSYSRTEESGLAIFRHCTASTVYDTGMIEDNPGDAATCGLDTIPSTLVCQPYLIGILQVRHPICATESDMNFPDRRSNSTNSFWNRTPNCGLTHRQDESSLSE
ncbi:hypothetical protein CPAR01_04513 [Colletotrichum paranaense]|uniref:Uncharacterized protein n=1 Tax=Colletotrichum paranaense TaxID=1914294 RepID=A0ABQ9SWJ0_9PEZI|nr:uncharacterized protein CPAR01_04513 [Colletotrichum paranaense]KAK1543880.1 hypothetical protein CPAR01_04513 [Colletotrichum paranaense]